MTTLDQRVEELRKAVRVYGEVNEVPGTTFTIEGTRENGTVRSYSFEIDEYESPFDDPEDEEWFEEWVQYIVVRDTEDGFEDTIGSNDGYPYTVGGAVVGIQLMINDWTDWEESMTTAEGFKTIRFLLNGREIANVNLEGVVE